MRARAAAALLIVAATARAQEVDDPHAAQPERPTVATHAYTMWPGWTEIEFGLELDRAGDTHVLSTPTTWKVGLVKNLQIEATSYYINQSDGESLSGIGDVFVSLKWRLADSLPVIGSFAIEPTVELPTGSAALSNGHFVGEFLLISSNQLGPVELDVNAGWFERLNDRATAPPTATLWTAAAGTPIIGSFGWQLEIFGYPGSHGPAGSAPIVGLLSGPTYGVHPWFVADAGIIVPLDGPQPHAVYVGLTWNMGRLWNATRVTAPSR